MVLSSVPTLTTERLRLAAFDSSHLKELFAIFGDSETMRYYDIEPYETAEQAQEMVDLAERRIREGTGVRWGIFLEETLVGTIGFNAYHQNGRGVLGYDLQREEWGKGIATEAVREVVRFGFETLEVHRAEAFVSPGNIGSQRVLTKSGFEREGILREVAFFRGRHQDQVLYAKLATAGK